MLSPSEQWTLHSYYEFTKNFRVSELLAHRALITQAQPSLPQRAGKALAALAVFAVRLERYRQVPHPSTRRKGTPYKARVFSQVNPDLDPDEFARILMQIAKEARERA